MSVLLDTVRKDVFEFLGELNELLFNERDLQIHLATWLRNSKNHYDDVDVEYYLPWQELERVGKYIWKSELRLDIVVKKDGEFIPIELKYKTKKVERQIQRFDELLDKKVVVMKNQGAQDLGMYDLWKDVRRLELVRKRFANVQGGLAVFLTNDDSYVRRSKVTSNNVRLSISEGKQLCLKHWLNSESAAVKTHPNFEVDKDYYVKWYHRNIDKIEFHYFLLCI